MRVAALYDIHANLPALEAVLREVHAVQVNQIVIGGDVLPGPMPRETLACLLKVEIPIQFIYGNGEVAVLATLHGRTPAGVPEQYLPTIQWNAEQIDPAHHQELSQWPQTTRIEIPGLGHVLFCHATPRDENEIFTRLTHDDRLAPIVDPLGVDVIVCGHTHMQFDRMVSRTRIVNAGSVGMPFGEPGADWLLLSPDVDLRHTSYDLEQAAARIRHTACPDAEEFAARSVLNPRSEAEMLQLFASARNP